MATSYPNSIDNFLNPTPTDTLNSNTVPHAGQHDDANDAIEAIETVLGTLPAGDSLTVSDRIGVVEGDVADLWPAVTGAQQDILDIWAGLGTGPTGSALALEVSQVSATGADVLTLGTLPGQVDSDATMPAAWFKFTIDGTDYGVPGYPIVPIV